MSVRAKHPTRVLIHLDRMTHNLQLLQQLVGARPLWPAIKGNAYGHGAEIVARHLVRLGYDMLCVAHPIEAVALREVGVRATFLILTPALPDHAETIVAHGLEPVVCTPETVAALSDAAKSSGRRVSIHVAVDTGMGRIGVRPEAIGEFLERCRALPNLRLRGLMSHFPRAHEADKTFSHSQLDLYRRVVESTRKFDIEFRHIANSAAVLDLPNSYFDAARPGIAVYGLRPSPEIVSARAGALDPVLEWKTRINFLKEVPPGTGLSYGHRFHTTRASVIATIPVGYGDGLSRGLSNNLEVLVHGVRCPPGGDHYHGSVSHRRDLAPGQGQPRGGGRAHRPAACRRGDRR